MNRLVVVACLMLALIFIPGVNIIKAEGGAAVVESGKKVKFNYTLTVDGKILDSSQGKEPMEYTHGQNEIIPGLEKQLAGLKIGDKKNFKLSSGEAYGPADPAAIKEMALSAFPKDFVPVIGKMVQLIDPAGRKVPATIKEIKKDSVMLDLNHPLAGKDLYFDVEVVSVQ